jgi:hypothetical protein
MAATLVKNDRIVTAIDDDVADILVNTGRPTPLAATSRLGPMLRSMRNIWASEHHSRVDYSLFEGRSVTGRVKKVSARGELIVDGECWLGRDGRGEFLRRGSSGAC